jgi:hypothetical protein
MNLQICNGLRPILSHVLNVQYKSKKTKDAIIWLAENAQTNFVGYAYLTGEIIYNAINSISKKLSKNKKNLKTN